MVIFSSPARRSGCSCHHLDDRTSPVKAVEECGYLGTILQKLLGFLRMCQQSCRWTRKYHWYFQHAQWNSSGTVVKQIRKLLTFSLYICKLCDGTELRSVRLKSLSIKRGLTFSKQCTADAAGDNSNIYPMVV